jgi:hypothetical protein
MKQSAKSKDELKQNPVDPILAYYYDEKVDKRLLANFLNNALYSLVLQKEKHFEAASSAEVLGEMIHIVAASNDNDLFMALENVFILLFARSDVKNAINTGFIAIVALEIGFQDGKVDEFFKCRKWLLDMAAIADEHASLPLKEIA